MENQNPHDPDPDKLGDDPHPDEVPKASGKVPKAPGESEPLRLAATAHEA
jgi:hypothetical protein